MGTADRRISILKALCRRRHDTIGNLAVEFGVSERTIRRDIEALSYREPLYTKTGRYGGGVYITEGYDFGSKNISESQIAVLKKILSISKSRGDILQPSEIREIQTLISDNTDLNMSSQMRRNSR